MKLTKKKFNARFPLKRRGYDMQAVDAYIELEQSKASGVQMEQKERIASLKAQCSAQLCELAQLREREEQIKSTLISATEKAEKMNLDIKLRYAMELDRLKLFRAKWLQAYEEMKERYHFSKDALNMESVAVSTEMEIQRFLFQDFSIDKGDRTDEKEANFKSEAERLTTSTSGVCELKEKLLEASEKKERQAKKQIGDSAAYVGVASSTSIGAAFSIEEAMRPKESLAEICQYLGLKSSKF